MNKYYIISLFTLFILAAGCQSPTTQQKANPNTAKSPATAKQYTCTMHADIIKDKPGTCPKCGMDLVEKDK